MKKLALGLCSLVMLSACQTTGSLGPGEVMGTDIGSILSNEAGLNLSRASVEKMNSEIDKALYFSDDGLTTRWYAGTNARVRPVGAARDRRDRDCRRFRHGVMIEGDWFNGSAVACRENNVAWYLIANRWDRSVDRDRFGRDDRDERRPIRGGYPLDRGGWENLADELGGNGNRSFDDFGARGTTDRW